MAFFVFVSFLIVILVLFFWQKLRKALLPKSYYNWEENLKLRIERKVSKNIFLVLAITLLFFFFFMFFLFVGVRPWYSIWVFVFGFLFVILNKCNLVQRVYLTLLVSSILPTLILARLLFIETVVYLFEVLGNFWHLQHKVLIAVSIMPVTPEATARKILECIKQACSQENAVLNKSIVGNTQEYLRCSELKEKSKWHNVTKISEEISKNFVRKQEALRNLPLLFNNFFMLEKSMHIAKLSNLDHFGFTSYSYERLLDPLLEQREKVVLGAEEVSRLANLLNSSEVINYCEVLKEQRKSMSSADFKVLLKSIIEQGQISGLTRHEANVFYNMLLVKLSTVAIPKPILESPSLEILYDKEGSHKKDLNAAVIDRFLYKPDGKQQLWGYKITSVMDPSILEAEAYMKLIKEQYGLEIKQKELHQRGLNVVKAERSIFVDYNVTIDNGEEVFLECKSIVPESLNAELQELQLKLKEGQTVEFYWENTRTWEKTLFKVTKDGYQEIYKEAPEKK